MQAEAVNQLFECPQKPPIVLTLNRKLAHSEANPSTAIRQMTENRNDKAPTTTGIQLDYLAQDLPFLSRVLRAYIRGETADAYRELEVEPGEIAILNLIHINEGMSQNDLSSAVVIKKSAVTKLVRSLEQRGLVTRDRVKSDKRFNALKLTPAGQQRVAEMKQRRAIEHEAIMGVLSKEEQEAFFRHLNRLCEHLAERHQDRLNGDG